MKLETSCSGNTFLCTSAKESMWFNAKLATAYEQVTARMFFSCFRLNKFKKGLSSYIYVLVLLQKLQIFHLPGVRTSLLQCHMLPFATCLSLWPHAAELFVLISSLGMAKSEWHVGDILSKPKACPGALAQMSSHAGFQEAKSLQVMLCYIWPKRSSFHKGRRVNCPFRHQARILFLVPFITQPVVSMIWDIGYLSG